MNLAFYRELIGNLNDAVICLNSEFKIEWVNKQAGRLFDLTRDGLKNRPVGFLLQGCESAVTRVLQKKTSELTNEVFELEAQSGSGRQFQAEVSVASWNHQQSRYYSLLIRDISEQKREQEALQKAQAFIEGRLEIENYRLLEEEKKFIKVQEELRLARDIQQHLLPETPPDIPGYDIAALNIPAKEVGGDYYDFMKISDDKLFFCLGDVSGKGIPAALLVANLQASLHSQSFITHSPGECVRNSNKLIHQNTDFNKFITLFYGLLDTAGGQIIYCNGGHDQPVFMAPGREIKELKTGGIPLGFMADYEYAEEAVSFDDGNLLVLYSDGITEAMNEQEEEFGLERLNTVIKHNQKKGASDMINDILDAVMKFTGETPQMDDMTLMIIKKDP
jgi:PAS domain S-box-containing protein